MIKKVSYGNFLTSKGNIVTIVNGNGGETQEWEFRRVGISADEVRACLSENGRKEGIELLMREGKLVPIYGGDLHL